MVTAGAVMTRVYTSRGGHDKRGGRTGVVMAGVVIWGRLRSDAEVSTD